jgi:hypothetical protein
MCSISKVHSLHKNSTLVTTNTDTITLCIDHSIVKQCLRDVATQERRRLANMIEVIIRVYWAGAGVRIPAQGELLKRKKNQPTRT